MRSANAARFCNPSAPARETLHLANDGLNLLTKQTQRFVQGAEFAFMRRKWRLPVYVIPSVPAASSPESRSARFATRRVDGWLASTFS